MTLTLYMFKPSPPVRAVLLAAAYLKISFDMKEVDTIKKEQMNPDFIKLNPQHTIPTLDDDGKVIWDSHAILGYLVNKYAKDDSLYPKDDPYKRALIDQRLHFESGVVFSLLHNILVKMVRQHKRPNEDDMKEAEIVYDFLEKFLDGKKWMVGDSLTLADFSLVASVSTLDVLVPIDAAKYPQVKAWLALAKDTFPQYEEINEKGLEVVKAHVPPP